MFLSERKRGDDQPMKGKNACSGKSACGSKKQSKPGRFGKFGGNPQQADGNVGKDSDSGDATMGENACPTCGKSGDACKCDPGADKTGTARKTKSDAHAPIKPGKARSPKEIAAYLANKSKNKGMLTTSDPSGDEY